MSRLFVSPLEKLLASSTFTSSLHSPPTILTEMQGLLHAPAGLYSGCHKFPQLSQRRKETLDFQVSFCERHSLQCSFQCFPELHPSSRQMPFSSLNDSGCTFCENNRTSTFYYHRVDVYVCVSLFSHLNYPFVFLCLLKVKLFCDVFAKIFAVFHGVFLFLSRNR